MDNNVSLTPPISLHDYLTRLGKLPSHRPRRCLKPTTNTSPLSPTPALSQPISGGESASVSGDATCHAHSSHALCRPATNIQHQRRAGQSLPGNTKDPASTQKPDRAQSMVDNTLHGGGGCVSVGKEDVGPMGESQEEQTPLQGNASLSRATRQRAEDEPADASEPPKKRPRREKTASGTSRGRSCAKRDGIIQTSPKRSTLAPQLSIISASLIDPPLSPQTHVGAINLSVTADDIQDVDFTDRASLKPQSSAVSSHNLAIPVTALRKSIRFPKRAAACNIHLEHYKIPRQTAIETYKGRLIAAPCDGYSAFEPSVWGGSIGTPCAILSLTRCLEIVSGRLPDPPRSPPRGAMKRPRGGGHVLTLEPKFRMRNTLPGRSDSSDQNTKCNQNFSLDSETRLQLSSITAPARCVSGSDSNCTNSQESNRSTLLPSDPDTCRDGRSPALDSQGTDGYMSHNDSHADFFSEAHVSSPAPSTASPQHLGAHASLRGPHEDNYLTRPGQASRMRSNGEWMEVSEDIRDDDIGPCLD